MTPEERTTHAALHAALEAGDTETVAAITARLDRDDQAKLTRLARPEALAEAAHWYAKQGIAVFPLKPGGKQPLLRRAHDPGDPCKGGCGRLGHGLHDATTDPHQVRTWWLETPAANVGIPTGHTFDVIDIDLPHGYLSLGELRGQGLIPPTRGRAMTASGGMHLYITPTGDGNTAGLRPGIDYRGAGGYVVAPPSRTADGMWLWTTPLELETAK